MNAANVTIARNDSAALDRRGLTRMISVRGGAALVVWFAGWSLSGRAPDPTPGTPTCREVSDATTQAYLIGVACPPAGFGDALGYEPVLVRTRAGWRYTRPSDADGRCSGPLGGLGRTLELALACRAHDYGYDLVRFGVGDRSDADELLYRDMMTICFARGPLDGGACRCLAHWTKAVLQLGDVTGFDPEGLPPA
jgi:hypothetical protein